LPGTFFVADSIRQNTSVLPKSNFRLGVHTSSSNLT
jgi:hypothetical protein